MARDAFDRVILVVMDSVGIGAMPDAADYGDVGSDTLGHVLASRPLRLPNLAAIGLGNIRPLANVEPASAPVGYFGKAAIASAGKDTTTGHWEMAGIITRTAFPTYPDGFPRRVLDPFERAVGSEVLGNKPASGTEIIAELGEEHVRTGRPIVYTSADSVFQIAAHEEVVPVDELYRMCEIAREILRGPDEVGRVIARPFVGEPGSFVRTHRRKDFAIDPPSETLLDLLAAAGHDVIAVGKIGSIFCHRGTTQEVLGTDNMDLVDRTLEAIRDDNRGLVFANLVDFDMLYGHRRDVAGYARALEDLDARIPEIREAMRPGDLCVLTADHGCDPAFRGTDHTREYVPIVAFGRDDADGASVGARTTMADIGQTIAENFGIELSAGTSFLSALGGR
jgi:phosphopentomutase